CGGGSGGRRGELEYSVGVVDKTRGQHSGKWARLAKLRIALYHPRMYVRKAHIYSYECRVILNPCRHLYYPMHEEFPVQMCLMHFAQC
ncbi:hypothetical protein GBAR_LOCUS13009, partial [Geodia barretti]